MANQGMTLEDVKVIALASYISVRESIMQELSMRSGSDEDRDALKSKEELENRLVSTFLLAKNIVDADKAIEIATRQVNLSETADEYIDMVLEESPEVIEAKILKIIKAKSLEEIDEVEDAYSVGKRQLREFRAGIIMYLADQYHEGNREAAVAATNDLFDNIKLPDIGSEQYEEIDVQYAEETRSDLSDHHLSVAQELVESQNIDNTSLFLAHWKTWYDHFSGKQPSEFVIKGNE